MRTLILLRHAKAESGEAYAKDFDRPLAPRGLTDAPKVAAELVAAALGVDLALVSSAQRTQETWFVIAPKFPGAEVKSTRRLYEADDNEAWVIAQEADAARVIIVGHNPTLHDLALKILKSSTDANAKKARKDLDHLPTSGAVAFEFPDGPFEMKAAKFLGFWRP